MFSLIYCTSLYFFFAVIILLIFFSSSGVRLNKMIIFLDKRMHSFLSRANTLFAFTLTVLAGLTIGVFISTYFEKYQGNVVIQVNKPIV